ncbi:MAG: SOS response-associated peptidase, partial [Bacteroidota bacterium]
EDMLAKPIYRKILRSHRCLIPADGFYIWKPLTRRSMVPYRIILPAIGLVSFAAIWEEFEDDKGAQQHTFSIITIPAQGKAGDLYDRMPLIPSPEHEKKWLDLRATEAEINQILEGSELPQSDYYSVSPAIEDTSKDTPSMILPAPPADQFGNLTLFD